MANMPKFRHELKYFISYADYLEIKQRIGSVMKPDSHNGGVYIVRSLYFDDLNDNALMEKINGVDHREKFRLRIYNGDPSFIRLEKKRKHNGLSQKFSVCLSEAACIRLLNNDAKSLVETNEPLCWELYLKMQYKQLKPKTIVEYKREAYTYGPGNVRITFDSDIHTGLNSTAFLDFQIPLVKATGELLMEIKYDNFIPELIVDMVQVGNRRSGAFSKYAACRSLI